MLERILIFASGMSLAWACRPGGAVYWLAFVLALVASFTVPRALRVLT